MGTIPRIQFADQSTSLMQDNLGRAIEALQTSPLVSGQLLSQISLISGQDNLITHSLGYAPTLVLPMAPNVNTTIWSPTSSILNNRSTTSTQVNLRCSTSCTVTVFIK